MHIGVLQCLQNICTSIACVVGVGDIFCFFFPAVSSSVCGAQERLALDVSKKVHVFTDDP